MKKIEIIIASGNKDKIREYKELFKDYPITVTSLKDENIALDVEETGTTFLENSLIKAHYIASKTNKYVISDDSGICIHALNDFPGVYSARFMEGQDYSLKNKAINEMLEEHEDKTAHYTCVIAFVSKEEKIEKTFEGKCFGHIISPIEGPHGFGYDPIFVPEGEDKPFSLINDEKKNEISHRGVATKLLMEYLDEYLK